MRTIRFLAVISILCALMLAGPGILFSRQFAPGNVKKFYRDIVLTKRSELESVLSCSYEPSIGLAAGKHYVQSRLIGKEHNKYKTVSLHIELDTMNTIVKRMWVSMAIVELADGNFADRAEVATGTALPENELKYYAFFKELKEKYGIVSVISNIDHSERQFWFEDGRLYYGNIPIPYLNQSIVDKIFRPAIRIHDNWLYIPY